MSIENRNKITKLSFILSILVIMIHVTNLKSYGITGGVLFRVETIIQEIANFAVPMFFTISGYFFFRHYSSGLAREKLRKRFQTVVIPYMIWGGIYAVFLAGLPHLPVVGRFIHSRASFLDQLLSIFITGQGTHLWYLRNLVVYLALAPLLYYLLRYKRSFPFFAAAMVAVHMMVGEGRYSLSLHSVFFYAGGWLSLHHSELVEKRCPSNIRYLSLGIFLAVCFLNHLLLTHVWWGSYLCYFVAIPLLWALTDGLRTGKAPTAFVKSSFFIYVSHVLILEVVETLFYIFLPHTQVAAALDYYIAPGITLACIFILEKMLRKNAILWGILTGNRG